MRRLLQVLLLWAVVLPGLLLGPSGFAALSVEQAVDRNGSCVIEDGEILWAVEYWISGEPLPATGGLTITDAKILGLMGLWISGESVCAPGATNRPPTVRLTYTPPNPTPADTVTFSASASDPDGDPLTYEWWLNGVKQPVTQSGVTWAEPPAGTLTVTVRVSDGRGGTAEDSVTIAVTGAPPPADVAQAFLAIINQYRSQSGQCWDMAAQSWVSWPASAARTLALSTPLNNAALYHSQFMADHDCFDHQCPGEPDLRARIEQAGYTGWTSYGENIAAGMETPEEAFEAWRNSPGHNRNMLTCQFRELGVGRVEKAQTRYRWYWTTVFGSR